jgi:colicin import membrane protein
VNAAAALGRDPLLPQAPGGLGAGVSLALLAHASLLLALTQGVSWKREEPVVAVAELWAAVPQSAPAPQPEAAPPKPEPLPPAPPSPKLAEPPTAPREAEIAIEREKRIQAQREEALRKRKEAEAAAQLEKEEREAREAKADEERLAQQREANLRRMMGQIEPGATARGGSAGSEAAPSASYTAKLVSTIRNNIRTPGGLPSGNPVAEVEVVTAPGGTILSRRIVKSSGVPAWDDAVLRAIDRTARLPRDENGRVPSVLIVEFRPQG